MKIFVCVLVAIVAGANALYSASDDVVELTTANFNKQVLQGDELWLVEFYAPWCGHCKSLAPEWKKAASALKGIAKVGAVDMDQHQSLGGPYNVKGFPTIKIFGLDKKSAKDYQGARQAQGIVDAAMTHIRQMASDRLGGKSGGKKSGGSGGGGGKTGDTKDVVELTDSNFDEEVLQTDELVLVEFFAPWCGHCKSLAPEWASAATQLKGKVKVAALDATVHTITGNRYGIEAYPTILFFQANKEDEILLYDGGLSAEDIVTFGQEFFAMIQPPPDMYEVRGYPTIKAFLSGKKDGEAVDYDGGRSASDIVAWALDKFTENIPPPEVNELTSQEVLKTACDDHQLCIISVLPHILDCQSQCRNNYISMLKTLAEKYKKRQWGYVWCEAGSQPSVEEALGIGGFGYPAMAAVNSRKMKFSLMKGSFSETGINEYLRALSVGRGSTSPLSNLPEVQNTEAWDGKDGELPVEEEWDLSDVELDDLDPLEKIEL